MLTLSRYVIITPARNEARFIELTLKSMVAQTIRPIRWVIVSDGSTDGTDEIVGRYAREHAWIRLVRMPERKERHFAGKAYAFNTGYATLNDLEYDAVGSLDADISFDEGYFQFLLERLSEDSKLGLVGTPYCEAGGVVYDYRFVSIEHVSGACQLFRRQCFESIGGYVPIKNGGVDLVAVITSRMKGWKTRSFTEKTSMHHRVMGSGMDKGLRRYYKFGQTDYRLGGHPVWELFRCLHQMTNRPYLVGGMLYFAGYFGAVVTRRPRAVSAEFIRFRGKEQMQRLKLFLTSRLPGKRGEDLAGPQPTVPSTSSASAQTGQGGR